MATKVLICDDSGFARRQMARSIPDGWSVEIYFAEQGQQALDMIAQDSIEVMFLDLNMPVLDGYQTMEVINRDSIPVKVIVVSGDVQPEARTKMMNLGAVDFIRKPVDNEKLIEILQQHNIYNGDKSTTNRSIEVDKTTTKKDPLATQLDAFREMANIAMGRAAEKLAKLLDQFIDLPVPNVNLIETTELHMAIAEISRNETASAISQGFISAGIKGEALLMCNDSNLSNMVKLLDYQNHGQVEELQLEALMDVTNILVGACLTALSEQLNVKFIHNHPIILGRNCGLDEILQNNVSRWDKVLAVEIGYGIKAQNINFDLLLLFPDKAIDLMFDKLIKAADKTYD